MPESITAQVMPVPNAENEFCAASAFTVAMDLLMHAEISKSGQIWKIARHLLGSGGFEEIAVSLGDSAAVFAVALSWLAVVTVASFSAAAFRLFLRAFGGDLLRGDLPRLHI